jgi:hypothetical protein
LRLDEFEVVVLVQDVLLVDNPFLPGQVVQLDGVLKASAPRAGPMALKREDIQAVDSQSASLRLQDDGVESVREPSLMDHRLRRL